MAFAAGIDFGKTDNRGTLCYQFFQSIVVISKRVIMVQFFDAVTIKISVEALAFSLQACLVGFQFLGGGFVHAFFGKYFYRKNSGLFAGSKGDFALAGFFPFYKNDYGNGKPAPDFLVESQSRFNLTEDSLIDYNVLSITTEGALS